MASRFPTLEIQRSGASTKGAEATIEFVLEGAAPASAPAALVARRRFKGGASELLVLPGAPTVLVVGLGKPTALSTEVLHAAAATAVRAAQKEHAATVAVVLPELPDTIEAGGAVRALLEGLLLGLYRFDRFITDASRRPTPVRTLRVDPRGLARVAKAELPRAEAFAESVAIARDLVNLPAGHLHPESMVEEVQRALRGSGVKIKVLGPRELQRERMGALLAVGQGSARPPRVVHLAYTPRRPRARLAFVGKGVTFDSGGYDIKPVDGMETMKCDMAGSAAVVAAVRTLAALGAPVEVHGFLGLVENLVSGNAYKPGDVLTTRSGKTVEINNTDAEGRLVLADVLDYALETTKPDSIVDLATLTGACMVALGPQMTGLFANGDPLAQALSAAAGRAGEKVWRLPLVPEYRDQLKSDIADMRNTGTRWGGAITAALFLETFVADRAAWAHLDIAGPAFLGADHPYFGKGGTGAGAGILVEYALSL